MNFANNNLFFLLVLSLQLLFIIVLLHYDPTGIKLVKKMNAYMNITQLLFLCFCIRFLPKLVYISISHVYIHWIFTLLQCSYILIILIDGYVALLLLIS